MTVAIGMMCQGGVAIAADSEESYTEAKAQVNKLATLDRPKTILAGSGMGCFIDYAKDQIFKLLETDPVRSADEFVSKVSQLMTRLYENEFRHYPVDSDHKALVLLVGTQIGNQPLLFVVDSTLVSAVPMVRMIGTELLKEEADEMQELDLSLAQARVATLYLVWQTKERFMNVGGKTRVASIDNDGNLEYGNTWNHSQIENFFVRARKLNHLLLLGMHPSTSDTQLQLDLRWIRHTIAISRQAITRLEHQFERERARAVQDQARIYSGKVGRGSKASIKQ